MFKNLFGALTRTSLKTQLQRELDEAQLNLLAAEAQLENAECYVQTYQKRVSRLKTRLAMENGAHAVANADTSGSWRPAKQGD